MTEVKESSSINGVVHVTPKSFGDARGRFVESYRREWFPNGNEMVQSNRSDKAAGAIVGLHYHLKQSDYWYVISGRARVVLHDLRQGSLTEGVTEIFELGDNNDSGVFIPPGVAHGFASLTDMTMTYMVDAYYDTNDELGVAWDDPALGIDWGVESPVVSDRDTSNPKRSEIPAQLIPPFQS